MWRGLRLLLVLLVVSVGLSVPFNPGKVSAQSNQTLSFTTSPVSLDLDIQPGSSVTRTIEIMNNNQAALPISMGLYTFSAAGESGEAAISPIAASDPIHSYVHFSPASFIAQPRVWTMVQMTINLPSTADLGYYFAVVFKNNLPIPTTNSTTLIRSANSILVLIDTHSKNEVRQAIIGNFSVSSSIYEYLPATFHITIQNQGNIFIAPTGTVYISRSVDLTHSLAALGVNANGANVLPKSSRQFSASWSDGFPYFKSETKNGSVLTSKSGQPITRLVWNTTTISHFRFGRYYAGLTMVYNNGQQLVTLHGLLSFWVIPWKLLLGALALLVLFGWVIYRAFFKSHRPKAELGPDSTGISNQS